MFNKSKIVKKNDERPTEVEELFAKAVSHFEVQQPDLQAHLRFVFISEVKEMEFKQKDGSMGKYYLVRIPYRSLAAYKKVSTQVIGLLEDRFKCTVIIVANRTIVSLRSVHHASQMRPRSRTLKAVHAATLEDIVAPSHINGRQVRVSVDGAKHESVFLDPMDKDIISGRLEAMTNAYAALTTHTVHFGFAKLTSFQKKKLEVAKAKKSDNRRGDDN